MEKHLKDRRADELSAIVRWMGAIVGERRVGEGGVLTVGDGAAADLPVPGELGTGDGFALASVSAGACEVCVPPGWGVKIFAGEREEAGLARRGLAQILLGAGERCVLSNWLFEIEVAMVHPQPSVRQGIAKSIDRGFAGWLGLAAALMLVIVGAALFLVKEEPVTPEGIVKRDQGYIRNIMVRIPEPPKKAVFDGKVIEAKPRPSDRPAPATVASRPRTRDEVVKDVKGRGLLKLLGGGGMIRDLVFQTDLGPGTLDFLTAKHGVAVAPGGGLEGLGGPREGSGPGTPLGIGGPGPIDGRRRVADVSFPGKRKEDTAVTGGRLVLTEGLDKEVVGRIIRMHLNQAKFCYDRELSKNPNLYGKVTVQFTIGGTGKVDEAHIGETEMNSEAVESCLVRNVRSWNFPPPKGGGQVLVTYPFVFKPAGS